MAGGAGLAYAAPFLAAVFSSDSTVIGCESRFARRVYQPILGGTIAALTAVRFGVLRWVRRRQGGLTRGRGGLRHRRDHLPAPRHRETPDELLLYNASRRATVTLLKSDRSAYVRLGIRGYVFEEPEVRQAIDRLRTASDADSLTRWAELFQNAVCDRADESTLILDSLGSPARTSGWALRLGVYSGADKRNGDYDADIYGFMFKHSMEHTWMVGRRKAVGVELGMQHHYLHGDIDGFWHRTYYLQGNYYPLATNRHWFLRNIRAGGGVALIPGFEEDAFTSRGIESTEAHFTYIWTIGWDFGMSGAPFFSGR